MGVWITILQILLAAALGIIACIPLVESIRLRLRLHWPSSRPHPLHRPIVARVRGRGSEYELTTRERPHFAAPELAPET